MPESLTRRWEWLVPFSILAVGGLLMYWQLKVPSKRPSGAMAPIMLGLLFCMIMVPRLLDRVQAWSQGRAMFKRIKESNKTPDATYLVEAIARLRAWDTQEGRTLTFRGLERLSQKLGVSLPRIWVDDRIVDRVAGSASFFGALGSVIPVYPGWARFIHTAGPFYGILAGAIAVVLTGSLLSVAPPHQKREYATILAILVAGGLYFAIGWYIAKQYSIVILRDQAVLTRFGKEIACFGVDDAYLLVMPTYYKEVKRVPRLDGVRWWMLFRGGARYYCDDLIPPCDWLFSDAVEAVEEYRIEPSQVCGGCGYSLRGLPSDAPCPECGSRLLK